MTSDHLPTTADTEVFELRQFTLGMRPFVVVEAIAVEPEDEDDDGLRLNITRGGGAKDTATLCAMALTETEGDANPLTQAVAWVLGGDETVPADAPKREHLAELAKVLGVDMPSDELIVKMRRERLSQPQD